MVENLSKSKVKIKRGRVATSVGILKGAWRPWVGLGTKSLSINAFGERGAPNEWELKSDSSTDLTIFSG